MADPAPDLSKVSHLELRQAIKPIIERYYAICDQIAKLEEDQRLVRNEISALTDASELNWDYGDFCSATDLPIFTSDQTESQVVLVAAS